MPGRFVHYISPVAHGFSARRSRIRIDAEDGRAARAGHAIEKMPAIALETETRCGAAPSEWTLSERRVMTVTTGMAVVERTQCWVCHGHAPLSALDLGTQALAGISPRPGEPSRLATARTWV